MKATPKEVSPDDLPSPLREVFGSNRANFLTDRIQGPAKTTNIKKPTDLVKIPKMLDNLSLFYQNLANQKKIKKNLPENKPKERGLGPLGDPWVPPAAWGP